MQQNRRNAVTEEEKNKTNKQKNTTKQNTSFIRHWKTSNGHVMEPSYIGPTLMLIVH